MEKRQVRGSRKVGAMVWCALMLSLAGGGTWSESEPGGGMTLKKQKSYSLGNALVEEGTLLVDGGDLLGVTVVTPAKVPLRAGVVWGHWLGDVKSDRSQYLAEAVQLADQGVVSVLPDMFWGDWSWYSRRTIDQDAQNAQKQVRHFEAAVNLVASLAGPQVPLGFVGHDYSALYGAPAVSQDHRMKAIVLVAMPSSQYDWAFFRGQPASPEKYKEETRRWEPSEVAARFLAPVFLQFSEQDAYVSANQRAALVGYFGPKAKTRVYPNTSHSMTAEVVRQERDQWLLERLRL